MMEEFMIKAVIFDMDGLMIDTEKLLVKYWLEAAHDYGYDLKREHILGIRSLAAKYAIPKLQAEIGKDFDYYKVRTLRIQLMNQHINTYGLDEKPGLGELLDYLKEHKYLTAVATATDPERTKQYLGSLDRLKYLGKDTSFNALDTMRLRGYEMSQLRKHRCEEPPSHLPL